MRAKHLGLPAAAALLAAAMAAPTLDQAPREPKKSKIDYNRDVRPILSEHCFKCHGPAAKEAKGGLRVHERESATTNRNGRVAIKPGDPANSYLIERVATEDEAVRMPPEKSGMPPLSLKEIAILEQWIREGAEYKTHWAFVPPAMPAMPSVSKPGWIRNGIDAFILSGLDAAKLQPEPEADKATLQRRVALTLTGLLPTKAEIALFQKDTKPDAYERMVDRYLASPHYGENQARYWLDAVRYGDTHGLHLDNERSVYPYRDWVVRAMNEDLPFDKFSLWQLAGDLLPNPTNEQLVATGYIRMNPTSNEGGAIEDEFLVRNTFDRVDTYSTVFLGLTVGCAKCHDHKYDPIPTRDYYRLYAYFNSTADKPLDGNEFAPAPVVKAMTPQQEIYAAQLKDRLTKLEAKVPPKLADAWMATAHVEPPKVGSWEVSQSFEAANFDAAFSQEFGPEPDGVADTATYQPIEIPLGKALENIGKKENAAVFLRSEVSSASDRNIELRLGSDDGIRVWVNDKLVHDNKVLRGVGQATDKVQIHLNKGANKLLIKLVNSGGPDGILVDIGDQVAQRIDEVYKLRAAKDASAEELLRKLYLEFGPETNEAKAYRKALGSLTEFDASLPVTLVAQELPGARPAYVLRRGEYTMREERVYRGIPKALGSLPKDAPRSRLGLATWTVQPKNPLVSRVFVNRVWQQHFGTGLVKTAEDFGAQGEWPSNPELLDYLAVQFVENGWSIKKLHKLILTSAAFRQRSVLAPSKAQADPENRLISRGPRFRLDAEVIRDNALYVSGLLVDKLGGKGVKPYQPDGLWEAIAFTESTTAKYTQDKGDALYRRSLYLFWKRTSPHPTMLAFDAPMRESCLVRRSRTDTPLQALVTLNEPAFFEAARTFGQRLAESKASDEQRVEEAFLESQSRKPTQAERQVLLAALNRYRETYASQPEEATKLLSVGESMRDKSLPPAEHAAWTLLASTLMNLDEFLTQH